MKLNNSFNKCFIETTGYLFIVLFTYAAFSKLSNFETFTVQLGQSPLLSPFAGWVAWLIPAIEIILATLLMFKRSQFFALTGSFALMVMFSAYIFIILNYSEFVPCSCGGILEKMNWTQHLYFNIVFCFLSATSIILSLIQLPLQDKVWKVKYKLILLLVTTLFAVGTVILLFIKSEQVIHQENNFVRRYPPHLYNKFQQADLKYTGYYFAGRDDKTLYLGNYSAPLSVLATSFDLKKSKTHKIKLDNYDLPYRAALVRVQNSHFYLTDGTIPCLFKGKVATWDATQFNIAKKRFSAFEPIDSTLAVIRSRKPISNESTIGIINHANSKNSIKWNNTILQKQIDGVFDADGMLLYNNNLQKIIYTYFYRNQFSVTDKKLQLSYRGNTIDTTTKAKIKIAKLRNGDRKMATPPLTVNRLISTADNYLFVNSDVRGKFESSKMWKQATAVDVYNLQSKEYQYSFYVYNLNNKKPNGMYATKEIVYFLFDNILMAYKLDSSVRR